MNSLYHVSPLGRRSPEKLEAVELFPWRPADFPGKKPLPKQRVNIQVVTKKDTLRGGIRIYPSDGKDSVYLCPDLISERTGQKVSLARALSDCGIKPNDTVNFSIDPERWVIGTVVPSPVTR